MNASRITPLPFQQPFQQPTGQPFRAGSPNVGSLDRVALSIGILYLFIILSRILDVGFSTLHIPMIILILLAAVSIPSGALLRGVSSKLGVNLALWVAWLGITVPFSQWRGGSTGTYMVVLQSFLLGICVIGLARTIQDASRLMRTVAVGGLVAALLSFVFGQYEYGRLVLGGGTFHDPNIYAMSLLMTVPIWLWMATSASTRPRKLIMYLALAPIMYAMLHTGSRGSALGLIALIISYFWSAPVGRKVGILAGTALLIVISVATLPDYLQLRYTTLFQSETVDNPTPKDEKEQEELGADAGSAMGRRMLLIDSLRLTLSYPLFGVGLDQFSQTNWAVNHEKRGNGPGAMVTHNTYTQISSESGIPGLILLLVLFAQCWRSLTSVIKQNRPPGGNRPHLADMAVHLRYSFIGMAVCSFFLSLGYAPLIYVMVGLFGGFCQVVQNELAANSAGMTASLAPAITPGILANRFQPGYVRNAPMGGAPIGTPSKTGALGPRRF